MCHENSTKGETTLQSIDLAQEKSKFLPLGAFSIRWASVFACSTFLHINSFLRSKTLGEMAGERFLRVDHRLLKVSPAEMPPGTVGKADAVARAFALVHRSDVAGHCYCGPFNPPYLTSQFNLRKWLAPAF